MSRNKLFIKNSSLYGIDTESDTVQTPKLEKTQEETQEEETQEEETQEEETQEEETQEEETQEEEIVIEEDKEEIVIEEDNVEDNVEENKKRIRMPKKISKIYEALMIFFKIFIEDCSRHNKNYLQEWNKEEIRKNIETILRSSLPIKEKDPKMPKRPKSSYYFFSLEKRKKNTKEQLKTLWEELPDSELNIFMEKEKRDKEKYDEEMKKYVPKEPKKNISAYFLFCQEKRIELHEQDPKLIITQSVLAQYWKDENKEIWKEKALRDKIRFQSENLLYIQKLSKELLLTIK